MASIQKRLILWTGERHCGKSTSVAKLVRAVRKEGFDVAGVLAASLYRDGKLVGFDAVDLRNGKRAPLARRKIDGNKIGPFSFIADGLKLGNAALSITRIKSADLIIVDEFGPLELRNDGWRKKVDLLLAAGSPKSRPVILLVVRQELARQVRQLYPDIPCQRLFATRPESIDKVISILRKQRTGAGNKMIKLDGMLMIGSMGANVGKTELACALLGKFGRNRNIIGIKVTTIKAKDGRCPRGGRGCGVCSSLEGEYCVTEETNSSSYKDTARLLSAGASRVFWLRVMRTHLKEGLDALLEIIGRNTVSICESNSLRQVVEPGLFLMVDKPGLRRWKSSARDVRKYVDRIVFSNHRDFDIDLDRIKLIDGKWTIEDVGKRERKRQGVPIKATAIIVAGGSSRRMGTDKSLLLVKGRSMIERIFEQLDGYFEQILISANNKKKFAFLGLEIVPDKIPNQGPLMGIASALEASANEVNFVVACDIGHIEMGFVRKLLREIVRSKADIVVPTSGNGKYEPLFAVYRKNALEAINKVLSSGGRRISDVFALCKVKFIELGDRGQLINLNTMAEYEEFEKKCSGRV